MTEFDYIPKKFVIVSETEPAAFEGLIWYNPNEGLWRLYKDGKWQILIPFYVGDSEPAEKTDGMLWFDKANRKLKVYNQKDLIWEIIGNWQLEYEIYDDFNDNKLTGRITEDILLVRENAITRCKRYRPEWETVAGSPSANDGALWLQGNPVEVRTPCPICSKYELEFTCTDLIATDPVIFYIRDIYKDADNYYEIYYYMKDIDDRSFARFKKVVGGSGTTLINLAEKIHAPGGTFVITLLRDSEGNFEILKDGVSQGTCTDTSITESNYIDLKVDGNHAPDSDLRVNWIYGR